MDDYKINKNSQAVTTGSKWQEGDDNGSRLTQANACLQESTPLSLLLMGDGIKHNSENTQLHRCKAECRN